MTLSGLPEASCLHPGDGSDPTHVVVLVRVCKKANRSVQRKWFSFPGLPQTQDVHVEIMHRSHFKPSSFNLKVPAQKLRGESKYSKSKLPPPQPGSSRGFGALGLEN